MNRLDLVAGPNGAGKSTFVERQLAKLLQIEETQEFIALGLLCESNGNFILTRSGKSVADSVAEAFV